MEIGLCGLWLPTPGHSLVPSHGDGWKEMASSRWTLSWGQVGQGGVGVS